MDIEGPLKISVMNDPAQPGWELHLEFTQEFRTLELRRQAEVFDEYLRFLAAAIASTDEHDRDLQGLLIVQQIAEQLQPHIDRGEIPLSETLVVEIAQQQGISIQDLIAAHD